jgi:hypothetical protein
MNPQRQYLRTSSSKLILLALLTGCAASPEDIAATYTSGDQYKGWSCEKIVAERKGVVSDLAVASAKQAETRSDDIAGVIVLALPVGSMSRNEDQEPKIARLKGERDALDRIAKQNNCVGGVASVTATAGPTRNFDQSANPKRTKVTTAAVPDANPSEVESQTQKFLSTNQLKSLFTGASVRFTSEAGNPGKVQFKGNGTMSAQIDGPTDVYFDDGRWWLKEPNLICGKFQRWRSGRTVCTKYVREGNSFIRYLEDGSFGEIQPSISSNGVAALLGVRSSTVASRPETKSKRSFPAGLLQKIPNGRLSGDQIKTLLIGRTIDSEYSITVERERSTATKNDCYLSHFFETNTRVRSVCMGIGPNTEQIGRWWLQENGLLCGDWGDWFYGQQQCYQVHKSGHKITFIDKQRQSIVFKVEK